MQMPTDVSLGLYRIALKHFLVFNYIYQFYPKCLQQHVSSPPILSFQQHCERK